MKKVLLAGTALLGLALTSAPAAAELNLDLGGHFRGYGVYADADDAAANTQDFDFRRDTEVHFTGEATSDNGLTVGVHYELALGGDSATSNVQTDEAYAYFAGNWGRTNFGKEDGAAYLLQVAAPSADSNVDGLRTQIQGFDLDGVALALDYDHADFRGAQRLTYLTPKFSGFQAGVSYAPEDADNASAAGTGAIGSPAALAAGEYKNLFEGAVRWDGEFEGFGLSAGAGYSTAEVDTAGAGLDGDLNTWNAGLNVAFQGFSVGATYLSSEQDLLGGGSGDSDTWVIGAAWDNGPYHVGASYLNADLETVAYTGEADRWTVGAGYTYGPGMSFRGSVGFGTIDNNGAAGDDDYTQVTVGTDIQF